MLKLGVSACVLGQKVRYDGGHKCSGFVAKHLAKFAELIPFCPEVAIGLGTPRPPIRLLENAESDIRLVDARNQSVDHTDKLNSFSNKQNESLAQLDGFILAAKSPSCGMERIKVYNEKGELSHRKGTGLFAAHLQRQFPCLPIEEDGRLNDTGLRESFITRVYAHKDFRDNVMAAPSRKGLISFHSRYKFLVMAYSPQAYKQLGQLVAFRHNESADTVAKEYLMLLMKVLSKPANRKKHTNTLMHLQGFMKQHLNKEDKKELSTCIESYRLGQIPLMAPIILLRHHLQHFPNEYLQQQAYFEPFPQELGLRA